MATTALNIVQRLGGPTLTTLCATFLAWRLGSADAAHSSNPGAFEGTFLLLCLLHTLLFAATLRLPLSIDRQAEKIKEDASDFLEAMSE
jgi:hypothetical protein